MFCGKCGAEIEANAKFCPKCGAVLTNEVNGSAPESSASLIGQSPVASGKSASLTGQALVAREEPAMAAVVKPDEMRKNKGEGKRMGKGKPILIGAVVIIALLLVILVPKLAMSDSSGTDGDALSSSDTAGGESEEGETEGDVPIQGAEAELLAILAEAAELDKQTNDEFLALVKWNNDEELIENCNQASVLLSDFLEDIAVFQERADALKITDTKLKNACGEYFHVLHDARASNIDILTFYWESTEYRNNVIEQRPRAIDMKSLKDYSKDIAEWTQTSKESLAAITPPACVESEWVQYKAVMDYNDSIVQKINEGIQYNDWLRYYSAINMTNRYIKAERNAYKKLFNRTHSEIDFASEQRNTANQLVQEIYDYAEMNQAERDAYTFEWKCIGSILLGYDAVDTIYPSLYNTYDAFVIVETGCISGTRDIVIEAEIPGFTQKYKQSFRLVSSYKAIYIKPPALTGELDLSSTKDAQISITVSDTDGWLIESKSIPVTLKSKYDFNWYSDEYGMSTQDNILCFLTPESSAITALKRQAVSEIKEISGGAVESFWGYQNVNSKWTQYASTYIQVAGLMSALNKMGVRYVMDTFSISEEYGQHILFPEDVIANQSGLCIETSLVIASALQSANMHAFLVFPPGHAMVAVEVWNRGEHAGEYFLIETTAIEASANKTMFKNNTDLLAESYTSDNWDHDGYGLREPIEYLSKEQWMDYTKNYFEYVIDCNDSRLLGLTPFAN